MIRVICTGKGSHREKGCGHSFDYGRFVRGNPAQWTAYDDWRDGPDHKPLQSEYTFTCRRCNRETRMKAKTLRTALNGLHAEKLTTLDISALHF
jgi:hypothetical protein